jgi:hypothetical protein
MTMLGVLHALFYRRLNGAQVGDLFMSLIHTCQLCGANSFHYLTESQRHAEELVAILRNGCPGTTMRRFSARFQNQSASGPHRQRVFGDPCAGPPKAHAQLKIGPTSVRRILAREGRFEGG